MAEDGGGSFDRERAVSLLQEATRLLQHYSSNPSSLNQQRNQQGIEDCVQSAPSNSTQNAPRAPLTRRDPDGESGQSRRLLENFQALFAPYSQRPRPSATSSVQISQPPAKKAKLGKSKVYFKRETWTHDFFCLADRLQVVAPTKSMKHSWLVWAEKMCFNMKANAAEVKAKLEETYPKLCNGGGFDILRRGPSVMSRTPHIVRSL